MLRTTMPPELMELLDTGTSGDVDFYCQYARISGGTVLLPMCGAGRVAMAIARQGVPVMALEADAGAVALAQRKAQQMGVARILFVQAEPAGFVTDTKYMLAAIPGGRLQALLTLEEQRSCLLAVRRSMLPGAKLVLDLPLWDPAEFSDSAPVVRRQGEQQVALRRHVRFDPTRQVAEETVECQWLDREGAVTRSVVAACYHRYATPGEMVLLLEACGFAPVCFGGFDQEPLMPGARRLVIEAEKNR
jgi:hypothetical protein